MEESNMPHSKQEVLCNLAHVFQLQVKANIVQDPFKIKALIMIQKEKEEEADERFQ